MTSSLGASVADLERGDGVLVVVPSMTFDSKELAKIPGAVHFEERMLWLLQVLRNPSARVVYLSSEPLPEALVDYTVSLVGRADAHDRLTLLSCHESTPKALTHKVLSRPDIQGQVREAVGSRRGVMMCHVATAFEGQLAQAFGVDLYACPPELSELGTKSASRQIFRAAGVPFPRGSENLGDREQVIEALVELAKLEPRPRRAVVKLNDGFAGGGNAIVDYPRCEDSDLKAEIRLQLDKATFVAADETPERYFEAFGRMGGVVEEMIDGHGKTSPSAQCLIHPDGNVRVISTHEQILGGPDRQTFYGCRFPASPSYSVAIAGSARRVAEELGRRGVIGHISIDFVCREAHATWEHFAIEVNLRMGGATAPISFLELAADGEYDPTTGFFLTGKGSNVSYTSADRIQNDSWRALNPSFVLDEADRLGLHFDSDRGSGSIFYMLGALPTVGKLGLVAIDKTPPEAEERFHKTLSIINGLTGQGSLG